MEKELKMLRLLLREIQEAQNALTKERHSLAQERDALKKEQNALIAERNAWATERDALIKERDALIKERDALSIISKSKAKKSFKRKFKSCLSTRGDDEKMERFIRRYGSQILLNYDMSELFKLSSERANYSLYSFLIDHKLNSGFEIDLPDMTDLVIALENDNLKEAKDLYSAHSNTVLRQLHGERWMWFCINLDNEKIKEKQADLSSNFIAPYLVYRLSKQEGWSFERIGTFLGRFEEKFLRILVNLGNSELADAYLKCNRSDFFQYQRIFEIIIENRDFQMFEVILKHTAGSFSLKSELLNLLMNKKKCDLRRSKAGRDFIRGMLSLELFIDKDLVYAIESILERSNEKWLKTFLKYEFRSAIQSKLQGCGVLSSVFGNPNVDVRSLLKNNIIDVNAKSRFGRTPLHFAVDAKLEKNVEILLNYGADPNVVDDNGQTPLELAFRNGIYTRTNGGKHLAAQLAIYEATGQSIQKNIEIIKNSECEWFKCYYEKCRQQLEQLKSHEIQDDDHEFPKQNLNMFALLAEKGNRITRYMNENHRRVIADFMNRYKMDKPLINFYYNALRIRIEIIDRLTSIVDVLSECMGIDKNHLIVHKIMNYLAYKDFMTFK